MADANKVLQGSLKYRDGKKWKQRWCVLQKLSPVADCLHLFFYKEYTECYKGSSKLSIPLLDFYGLDDSCQLEKENHVLTIVCKNRVVVLAFDNQETLEFWKITIHRHVGEGRRFRAHLLKAPSFMKFSSGPVNAFIHQSSLCLSTSGCFGNALPRYLASWKICDLKRFGILDDKFVFEVEEKNGSGVYSLSLVEMREFNYLLRHIAQGNFDATNIHNPLHPSRPTISVTAEAATKPRLISPVYKSFSLCQTVNPRLDYVDGSNPSNVVMSTPLIRRQMSEPYELVTNDTANSGNRLLEYGNISHGLTMSTETTSAKRTKMKKLGEASNRRYSCDDSISNYLNMMTYNPKSLSWSMSKICCSGNCCCSTVSANVDVSVPTQKCCCSSRGADRSAYVNVTTDMMFEKPVSSQRNQSDSTMASDCRCTSSTDNSNSIADAVFVNLQPSLQINTSRGRAEDSSSSHLQQHIASSRCKLSREAEGGSCSEDPPSVREPSKPLKYVDLRRFDGDTEEGYLYWVKGSKSDGKKRRENAHRCQSSSYLDKRMMSAIDAKTLPPRTVEPWKILSKCQNVVKNGFSSRSSIHGSLKRGTKLSILEESLLSSTPISPGFKSSTSSGPFHEGPKSSESYAELRLEILSPLMCRGSEYYNLQLNTIVPLPPRRTEKSGPIQRTVPVAPIAPVPVSRKESFSTETGNLSCRSPLLSVGVMERSGEDVEYISMYSQSPADDNDIFFTVDLPLKKVNIHSSELQSGDQNSTPRVERKSNFKFSLPTVATCSSSSSSSSGIDPVGYVDMTIKGSSASSVRSVLNREPEQIERPKLRHSRSLEDELDLSTVPEIIPFMVNRRTSDDVLQCWTSNVQETLTGDDRTVTSGDYVSMAGSSSATSISESMKPSVKPFDNLILHRLFGTMATSPLEPRNTYFDHSLDSFSSDSALNSLAQRNQPVKFSKGAGILSKFLRRHSSAKEKTMLLDSRMVVVDYSQTGSPRSCLKKVVTIEEIPLDKQQPSLFRDAKGGGGDCCKNSSLEILGLPPSLSVSHCPFSVTNNLHTHQYVNLNATLLGQLHPVASSVEGAVSDEQLPPPLPPKGLTSSKCNDMNTALRNSIPMMSIVDEKPRIVEKPPSLTLVSIQEDEQELPPLPEKTRVRRSSKKISPDVSPKPPVPPRSISSTATSSSPSLASTPWSMEPSESPDVEAPIAGKRPDCFKSRKPNLTVDTGASPKLSERRGSRDDPASIAFKAAPILQSLSELRTSSMRSRNGSDVSTIASISSGDENRPSPALTTLRPRYGKEYQCIDRRRLAEDNWSPYTPQQKSPSMTSSFFSFDLQSGILKGSTLGGGGNNSSSGENSPKYPPSLRSRLRSEHTSSSHNGSPIILDSPRSVDTNVLLNYADIDLLAAAAAESSAITRSISKTNNGRIEYALIDMIATSALSRASQKHTRQREGILLERKERTTNELKDMKQGINRSLTMTERKVLSEPRRTPSMFNREPKF